MKNKTLVIVIPRGKKLNTRFPISGKSFVEAKLLYKTLSSPSTWEEKLGFKVETVTSVETEGDIRFEYLVSISPATKCLKVKYTVTVGDTRFSDSIETSLSLDRSEYVLSAIDVIKVLNALFVHKNLGSILQDSLSKSLVMA